MKYILLAFIILVSIVGSAQRGRNAQRKDSLRTLVCPVQPAVEVIEKAPFQYDKPEIKIVLSSPSDTTVKAGIDGTVTNVQRDEDGKWLVVFFHNDYWFWYSGISKVAVRKNQKLKTGEPLGYIAPGDKVELVLYDFETQIDPKRFLDCKLK
jgi:hypothetical protein